MFQLRKCAYVFGWMRTKCLPRAGAEWQGRCREMFTFFFEFFSRSAIKNGQNCNYMHFLRARVIECFHIPLKRKSIAYGAERWGSHPMRCEIYEHNHTFGRTSDWVVIREYFLTTYESIMLHAHTWTGRFTWLADPSSSEAGAIANMPILLSCSYLPTDLLFLQFVCSSGSFASQAQERGHSMDEVIKRHLNYFIFPFGQMPIQYFGGQ